MNDWLFNLIRRLLFSGRKSKEGTMTKDQKHTFKINTVPGSTTEKPAVRTVELTLEFTREITRADSKLYPMTINDMEQRLVKKLVGERFEDLSLKEIKTEFDPIIVTGRYTGSWVNPDLVLERTNVIFVGVFPTELKSLSLQKLDVAMQWLANRVCNALFDRIEDLKQLQKDMYILGFREPRVRRNNG